MVRFKILYIKIKKRRLDCNDKVHIKTKIYKSKNTTETQSVIKNPQLKIQEKQQPNYIEKKQEKPLTTSERE